MSTNCYLVADEVGLGKTRVASGVIHEIKRLKKRPIRVVYIASSTRISEQNMRELERFDVTEHETRPAPFQDATIKQVMHAFYDEYSEDQYLYGNGPTLEPLYTRKKEIPASKRLRDRLSVYYQTRPADNVSFALALSPKTSFYNGIDQYGGEQDERTDMDSALDRLKSCVREKKSDVLLKAIAYEDQEFESASEEIKLQKIEELRKILDTAGSFSNTGFGKLRRIFCNANLLLLKPDLVILDEFQRYRNIIETAENGYSIQQMYEFLQDMAKDSGNHIDVPKILLLSATPYHFNHKELAYVWQPDGEKKAKTEQSNYQDIHALIRSMKALGGRGTSYEEFLARTQRDFFFSQEEKQKIFNNMSVRAADPQALRKHTRYLSSLYKAAGDMEVRYARHTPHFWRFPGEFKSLEKLDASPDILKAFEEQALAPENHLLLAALLKYGLPEGTERMLWVPPTKCDTLQGIFKEYRRFGKTLAFTHYHMAAKAIGVLVSEEAEQRLSRVQAAEKASRLTLTGLDYPAECVRQCVSEEAISAVYQSINKARDPQKEPIYSLEEDLECFFWQPYARAAIQAELESCGAADTQNVELYCKNGGFLEMLLEYQGRFEKDADFLRSLHTVLRAKRGSCKLRSSKGGTVFEYSAAVYYTDDDTDSDSHKKDYEKELAEGFKSPVFPLVMAVTATAQEGLNLHEYADKLMHWQPSVNVNAFQQREGRVDRPNSLTIRRRYCDIMKAFPEQNAAPSSDNMVAAEKRFWTSMETNMTHPDRYEKIRSSLPDETARQQLDHAREAGLYPKWYIPEISKSDAKIQRIIAVSEYNADHDVFMRLLDGTKAYSKFMEHVDEKALCPFYRQKKLSADEAEKNG